MKNSHSTSDGISVFTLKRPCCSTIAAIVLTSIALSSVAQAQTASTPYASSERNPKTRRSGRSHVLVQFASQPGADQVNALNGRGATVLSYVPDSTLSVSLSDGTDVSGLGIQWMGRLHPSQKISPQLKPALNVSGGQAPAVLVEFYSDVLDSEARAIASGTGATIHDNPDLLPHHLLIEGTVDQVRQLADWDEVSYIFPASAGLVQGLPVHGCAGALTATGPVTQSVPIVGGWAGTAQSSASLNYSFVYLTQQDPEDSVQSEIERAYAEWSKYVQVSFTQTNDPNAAQTIAVLFASGPHGDGYPFTGPTGVIAHTFYPYPLNPESIAGHQHFNNDVSWKIGADVDVFSVALHETGHALGLGHSDNPADVMYPYYRMVSGLSSGDISAAQQLYEPVVPGVGSNNPSPPSPITPTAPAATPLTLTIQPPPATTNSSSVSLSGTVSGGAGSVQVSWSTNQGSSGSASQSASTWTVAAVPLSSGTNFISVTAQDSTGDQASQGVIVSYEPPPAYGNPNPPSNPSPSPPANPSPSGAPPSITILSPPMTMVATSAPSIVVSGTAQDAAGISQITWSTSTGASGVASGTNTWTTGPIPLYQGMTTVMIYATDTAGNQAWRSISVTQN